MSEPIFNLQRIYVKESSFLSSNTPELFRELGQLKNEMELKLEHKELEKHHYEVVLDIAVKTTGKVKDKEREVSNVKVKHAGVFRLEGFKEEELKNLLDTYCPEMLYPYARHVVTELTVMGSLPPVMLAPVNFHMLQKQAREEQKQEEK